MTMGGSWVTVAEGDSLDDLHSTGVMDTMPHNTTFDVVIEPMFGFLANIADIAGAEWVAESFMSAGAIVDDVEGKDGKIYIHCHSNAVQIIPLLAVIAAVFIAVALFIIAIKVNAFIAGVISIGIIVAILAGIALVAYLIYKGLFPEVRIGGS